MESEYTLTLARVDALISSLWLRHRLLLVVPAGDLDELKRFERYLREMLIYG